MKLTMCGAAQGNLFDMVRVVEAQDLGDKSTHGDPEDMGRINAQGVHEAHRVCRHIRNGEGLGWDCGFAYTSIVECDDAKVPCQLHDLELPPLLHHSESSDED